MRPKLANPTSNSDLLEMWLWSVSKPINYFKFANQAAKDYRSGYGWAPLRLNLSYHLSTTTVDSVLSVVDDNDRDGTAFDEDEDDDGTNALNNYWALLAIVLVFGTAAGNILVCLAIVWERRLQNVTNYFLMSLAITDLMVALSVMPLGILTLVRVDIIASDGTSHEIQDNYSMPEFEETAVTSNSDLWNTALVYIENSVGSVESEGLNTSCVSNNNIGNSTDAVSSGSSLEPEVVYPNIVDELCYQEEPFCRTPRNSSHQLGADDDALEQVSSVLENITNERVDLRRKCSISDFLDCPEAPKRSSQHRNYKRKFYPVLTAGERLAEIRRVEEEKQDVIKQRKENAEKRAARKVEAEKLKEISAQQRKDKFEKRAQRKIEAEQFKAAMRERRREELAIRKQERENLRQENRLKKAASKRNGINLFKTLNLSN